MKYRRPKRRSQVVEDANSRLQHAVVRGESNIILNKLRKDLEKVEAKEKPGRNMVTKTTFMKRAQSLGIEIEEITDPVWRSTSFGADAPHGFVFADHGTHFINLGEYMVGEKRDWAWMMGELIIAPCPDIGNDCEICDE